MDQNKTMPTTFLLLVVIATYGINVFLAVDASPQPGHSVVPQKQLTKAFECNTVSRGRQGTIHSPHYPSYYPINVDCAWDIVADAGHKISVDFQPYFSIEKFHDKCGYDYLEIIDFDPQGLQKSIGKYCGVTAPSFFVSTSRHVQVRFHSNYQITAPGFSLTWKWVSDCGGKMPGHSGQIKTPNWPRMYNTYLDCTWELSVERNFVVLLTFLNKFNIEYNYNNCEYDYVEVFDLNDSGVKTSRGKYCGNKRPQTIMSSNSRMIVHFHSNERNTNVGFSAKWEAGSNCGGVHKGTSGIISSVDYPSRYPNNEDCSWDIIAPASGYNIRLKFDSTFGIEKNYENCGFDYVEVQSMDPNTLIYHTEGKYCGNTAPLSVIESKGDVMRINFHSNDKYDGIGFKASWQAVCEHFENGTSGVVSTYNYPNRYPNQMDCTWHIEVDPKYQIHLQPDPTFKLESNYLNCHYDYLEIFVEENGVMKSREKICEKLQERSEVSTTNKMMLKFHSNDRNNANGFALHWNAVPSCNRQLHMGSGVISSFNHPEPYYNYCNCEWDISVSVGYVVYLVFDPLFQLEVGKTPNDCPDYVEVFDVHPQGYQILRGKFCGQKTPPPILSKHSRIIVKFVSNDKNVFRGFLAHWTSRIQK